MSGYVLEHPQQNWVLPHSTPTQWKFCYGYLEYGLNILSFIIKFLYIIIYVIQFTAVQ